MHTYSSFVPIRHQHLDAYYRVPVWVERLDTGATTYVVSVGDNARRFFNEDTVPTAIKALIAMVDAFPYNPRKDFVEESFDMSVYLPSDPKQVEVGWRVRDNLYVLVLSIDVLEDIYIRGPDG